MHKKRNDKTLKQNKTKQNIGTESKELAHEQVDGTRVERKLRRKVGDRLARDFVLRRI
jgi:hypothetical protein